MFRNQYDNDIGTWSPQGRLFQVEYAMEAVKQGACSLGLKSKTHVVLCSLKLQRSELADTLKKIMKIDDNCGCAFSGLIADATVLVKSLRSMCLNHKMVYEQPMPVEKLVGNISDKAQVNTQRYGKRPYGVGILIGGVDKTGTHLFEFAPSAVYTDFKAHAIGSRSQSAKTYMEKSFTEFPDCTLDQLIIHGLTALRNATPEKELTDVNGSVSYVGLDGKWTDVEGEELSQYIGRVTKDDDNTMTRSQDMEDA